MVSDGALRFRLPVYHIGDSWMSPATAARNSGMATLEQATPDELPNPDSRTPTEVAGLPSRR